MMSRTLLTIFPAVALLLGAACDRSGVGFSSEGEGSKKEADISRAETENLRRIYQVVEQIEGMPAIGEKDITALERYISDIATWSETLAAQAAWLLADAVEQKFFDVAETASVTAGSAADVTTSFANTLYQMAARYELVGSLLDVQGTTITGKSFRLDDLRGKVVVVDIFATWCVPCRDEHEVLLNLEKRYGSENLAVVAISADSQAAVVEAYMRRQESSWPTLLDSSSESLSFTEKYGITQFPTIFVIGRDGKVVTTRGTKQLPQLMAGQFQTNSRLASNL